MKKYYLTYDIFINSSRIQRVYSKRKAIDICQQRCCNMFTGHRHGEVVCYETGEVVYSI